MSFGASIIEWTTARSNDYDMDFFVRNISGSGLQSSAVLKPSDRNIFLILTSTKTQQDSDPKSQIMRSLKNDELNKYQLLQKKIVDMRLSSVKYRNIFLGSFSDKASQPIAIKCEVYDNEFGIWTEWTADSLG